MKNKIKWPRVIEKVEVFLFKFVTFDQQILILPSFDFCLLTSPERQQQQQNGNQSEQSTASNNEATITVPESPSSGSNSSLELNPVLPRPHNSGLLSPPPPPTPPPHFPFSDNTRPGFVNQNFKCSCKSQNLSEVKKKKNTPEHIPHCLCNFANFLLLIPFMPTCRFKTSYLKKLFQKSTNCILFEFEYKYIFET